MAVAEADFLAEKRAEMDARLVELKPLHEEYERLLSATEALDAIGMAGASAAGAIASAAATRTKAPRATRRSETNGSGTGAAKRGRGRPKGTGSRAVEAVSIVAADPGLKIPEIADRMGIKQNYLYRLLPELATAGKLVKASDGGWHPVASPAAESEPVLVPVEA